jgi:phenylpropionate dioxygenase-like ring-hydroxylating dioxygenase large terminal subunit
MTSRSAPSSDWHPAADASEIGPTPLGRTIAGRAIVLFRRQDGTVAALADRCPHYDLPLSSGRIVGDEIECGYHGLRFDGSGTCTYMPARNEPPKRFCVTRFHVAEKDGDVFVRIPVETESTEQ